jgi:hypothetical protein
MMKMEADWRTSMAGECQLYIENQNVLSNHNQIKHGRHDEDKK